MLGQYWNTILQWIRDWGNNQLIGGLAIFLFGLLVSQIPKFWKILTRALSWLRVTIWGKETDTTFERKYLNWLIDDHRYLNLIPAQIIVRKWGERQKFVDLEKIYVRLSVSAESGDEQWAETYGKGGSSWRKPLSLISRILYLFIRPWLRIFSRTASQSGQTYQSGDLGLAIDRRRRLVIRGDPGSGKTTLLRYLALSCARARRKNKGEGDSPRAVKKRLLWDICPFPMLVTLRRHGKVMSWGEEKAFVDTFLEEMPSELRKIYPEGFFERRLNKGNCLILLDGFDELGSAEARLAMARRISGFLQFYNHATNRIVVTTRIVGYEGQLDRSGFSVRTVQNLHAGEIRALVKQRYNAVIITETAGRQPHEARAITRRLERRAEQLIEKIESAPRLGQLATNPMLLSLIVLVHYLKIELPEERIYLYRDCVEILTERWQQVRLEEAGVQREQQDDLMLSQKLALLREIAFAMQKQRQDEGSQALMPRGIARDLIAAKLPELLVGKLPASPDKQKTECLRKADEWIKGIMAESGILVELGLDEAGEPLVGFSHLTFQEFLAAEAFNEQAIFRSLLLQNLLMPAWREVVLLYAALTNDATPVITALLEASEQPKGILLAGFCLAERLKKIQPDAQQKVLARLKEGFLQASDAQIGEFEKVMTTLKNSEITAFLRQQLNHAVLSKRLVAIRVLGEIGENDPEISAIQADLAKIVETSTEVEMVIAARESLAQIGDPRFEGPEPVMVRVPKQTQGIPASPRNWKELKASPVWHQAHLRQRLTLLLKMLDYMAFRLLRQRSEVNEFEIGKYPVTNMEYSRFVEETGQSFPEKWVEGKFSAKEAYHPVSGITSKDARAYCAWLQQQTGKSYRLPTEWEWEWAASGPDGYIYPWGALFDKNKCNTKESGIDDATPVGSYYTATSWVKANDMIGNVWEISEGFIFFANKSILFTSITSLLLASLILLSGFLFSLLILMLLSYILITALTVTLSLTLIISLLSILLYTKGKSSLLSETALNIHLLIRGGSWNSPAEQATCFQRRSHDSIATKFCGFRCARDISPGEP